MYAPMAPNPHPSNTADYSADDLLGVIASNTDAQAILAGAYLDYARWITNWSPPEFKETRRKPEPHIGSKAWRRKYGFSRTL